MRLHVVVLTVLCAMLVSVAGAQTLNILDWGGTPPETTPTASWYGSTGLIVVPTALVTTPMKLTGGAHRIQVDGQDDDQDVYNVNLALTADLEFGVTRIDNIKPRGFLSTGLTDETVFNAKYNIDLSNYFGLDLAPEFAVGAFDLSDELNRTFYVVASKALKIKDEGALSQFTLHVGWGQTKHNFGALDGFFAGLDFIPFSNAIAQVEWDNAEYNACIRYYPIEWLSLDAGVVDGEFAFGLSAKAGF
ncbi:hypothetical protein LLH03_16055 [bacterium]|nr:hypothetical protein [bacterium]